MGEGLQQPAVVVGMEVRQKVFLHERVTAVEVVNRERWCPGYTMAVVAVVVVSHSSSNSSSSSKSTVNVGAPGTLWRW